MLCFFEADTETDLRPILIKLSDVNPQQSNTELSFFVPYILLYVLILERYVKNISKCGGFGNFRRAE